MAITQLHTTPKPYPIAGYWEDKKDKKERKKDRKTRKKERQTEGTNTTQTHITQPICSHTPHTAQ